jgi:uncharacterized protein YyaL (SSP411 family)
MLAAADRSLGDPVDVVVAAVDPHEDGARRLREAAASPYVPDLVLAGVASGDPHAAWPLFAGKHASAGPTAYACRGDACDAPTYDPVELGRQVAHLAPSAGAAVSAVQERQAD